MAGKKKVGKRHRSKKHSTKVVPEHLMGKSLHKKVSRKRSRRK